MADDVPVRTVVTFRSKRFNSTEAQPYFINPCCFGDDVAKWMMDVLKKDGHSVGPEPGQEDFGWYFTFAVDGEEHCAVVAFREDDPEGEWVIWLERSRGFMASLFGRRNQGITRSATEAIHRVLSGAADVGSIRWYYRADFDAGRDDRAAPMP